MKAGVTSRRRRCRVRVAPSEKSMLRARVFGRCKTRRSRRFGPCLLPLMLCSSCCPVRCHARACSSGDTRSPFDCARSSAQPAVHSAAPVRGLLLRDVPHDGCAALTTDAGAGTAARAVSLRHAGRSALLLRGAGLQARDQGQRPGDVLHRVARLSLHAVHRAAQREPAQTPPGARRGRAGATGHGRYGAGCERAPAGRWRARVRLGPVGSRATRAARRGHLAGRAPARRVLGTTALAEVSLRGSRSPRCACVLPTLRGLRRPARRACVAAKATPRATTARQRASGARRARVSPRAPRAQQPAVRVDHRGVRAPRAPARLRVRSLSGSGLDPCCATVSPDAERRASSARALRAGRRARRAPARRRGPRACSARATRRRGEGDAADQRVAPAAAQRRARPRRCCSRETCGALGARTHAARRCQRPRAA